MNPSPKKNTDHGKSADPKDGSAAFGDHRTRDQQRKSSGGLDDSSSENKVRNDKPYKNLKG